MDKGRFTKSGVKKILAFALFLSAAFICLLWVSVNYVFIPKIVLPKLQEYLAANMSGPVKLTVKDISFNPLRGFLLHKIELSGPVALKENYILRVETVDVDLELLPLLWKQIAVKRFVMYGTDLNIGRDSEGKWNFQPLLDMDIVKEMMMGDYAFVVKEFRIKKGQIDYSDYLKKDNMLERRFTNINLSLTNPKWQTYNLVITGSARDRKEEDVMLEVTYEWKRESVEGTAVLNTRLLSEYWDYYLDDIFKPWHLKAEEVSARILFSYLNEKFTMKGQYVVNGAALTYGDLIITGDASIGQDLRYVKSVPAENAVTTEVSLSELSLLTGQNIFLDKGSCKAVITEKEVTIGNLSGEIKQLPVSLSGRFLFLEPRELHLSGKTGEVDNTFYAKLVKDNQCAVDWEGRLKDSYLKLHADMPDLKDLVFSLTAQGEIRLPDIGGLIGGIESFKGKMKVSGDIKGEADKPGSLNGKAVIKVEGFAFLESAATSFEFDMVAKDGLFRGTIPRINFCGGNFQGEMKATADKLGVELDIDKFDMSKFVGSKRLKGTGGIVDSNVAFITNWTDPSNAVGGGYIKATDCDLRKVPLFLATEEGIGSITKNASFQLPVFKKVEGNYEIKDKGVYFGNVSCKASGLSLTVSGRFLFSGMVDFTAGAQFLGSHLFKTARQILLPETIGLDLITDGIVVRIEGQWPDLKQSTTVQPLRSLSSLIPSVGHGSPDRYTLKKLWP